MVSPGPQSALIVVIPEAEPAVGRHRALLDASARLGIPAHVTVLFPFMPPGQISAEVLMQLERLFSAIPGFGFQLDHTDWFGDDVLWLAPSDPGRFRALTRHVFRAFPEYPPFEGQFDEVVPHLTVGNGHPRRDLRAAEESVQGHLPIDGHATAITLMTQQSAGDQWTNAATFTLGG